MLTRTLFAALRRHKAGATVVALQIALTLAIVSNALFIIGQRIAYAGRPSGVDEPDLLLIDQYWAEPPDGGDPAGLARLDAMQREDVAALQALPDVASVAVVNGLPLLNNGSFNGLGVTPDQKASTTAAGYYYGDEHMLATLGLRLVAGRDFRADEVRSQGLGDANNPPVAMVTRALADKLFPNGALGKSVYLRHGHTPTVIVGVVERLQIPFLHLFAEGYTWQSILLPVRQSREESFYAVRAKPGRLEAALKAMAPALYAANPMRMLTDESVRSYAQIRAAAYRSDLGMALVMGAICIILLAVTGAGIVGLSGFWVSQRRGQIGVRRALGARQVDILRHFQRENLLIAGAGVALGLPLARLLNLGMMHYYEMARLPTGYLLAGALLVLALGQAAVLGPARRAARVPPAAAARVR